MRIRHTIRGLWRRNWAPKVPNYVRIKHPPVAEARATILDSLEPLFTRAKREKLWFWNRYYNAWFSPSELTKLHKQDKFIWGPDNWTLRDPSEYGSGAKR